MIINLDLKAMVNETLFEKEEEGFEILYHLNKKIIPKTVAEEKIVYFCICFLCFLVFCPKKLKLPSGSTKLCRLCELTLLVTEVNPLILSRLNTL